jgi:hypothetical protein
MAKPTMVGVHLLVVNYSRHHPRPSWLPNNLELDRCWQPNTKEYGWYIITLSTTHPLDKFLTQADPSAEQKKIGVIGPFRRKIETENYACPTVGLEPKKMRATPAERRKREQHFQRVMQNLLDRSV